MYSSARRIFWLSLIFDIFNSQQAIAQKPLFSAKNDNNFKAACCGLKISKIGDRHKMRRLKLNISATKH